MFRLDFFVTPSLTLSFWLQYSSFGVSSSSSSSLFLCNSSSSRAVSSGSSLFSSGRSSRIKFTQSLNYPSVSKISEPSFTNLICRAAAEYKFPDPIPEFAETETEKFKTHLLKKLPKKDIYGDSVQEIVGICTEIFNTFLHTEYGGPGTLMVVPFIDMADTLNEKGLPGGPQAARTAIKWAQAHVDKDWNEWTGEDN